MSLEQKDWLLIQKHLAGNSDPKEFQRIQELLSESPENQQLLDELKKIWDQTPAEDFDVDVQHAWEQFSYRNQKTSKQLPSIGNKHTAHKRNRMGLMFKAVAGILIILFSGIFTYYQLNSSQETEPTEVFTVLEEIVTAPGEKVSIKFSDGTKMMLNSASSIRFPEIFQGSKREVYLDGEAYFEVVRNSSQPFVVYAQDAEIEVLGTEFNVKGWTDDPSVEVVVNGGRISVQSTADGTPENSEVFLTEGFKTKVERGQLPEQPHKVDSMRHILWTSGGIHFDSAPFYLVVRNLERQFNVNITVSVPDLLDTPYTGTFQNADLNEVLEVIAASMEAGLRRDGSQIEFYR